jgi:hypothetical protein
MGKTAIILPSGTRFGRLTVLGRVPPTSPGQINWECRCDCGKIVVVTGGNLRRKNGTRSCRCLSRDRGRARRTHGRKPWRLYRAWTRMKNRCSNPTEIYWHGRGITVCPEWLTSYEAFRDWALANGYHANLSLDRIDNNGNYEPANCRWTTQRVQASNSRRPRAVIRSDGHRFSSIADATRATPRSMSSHISAVCRGVQKTHAGYVWSYA